MFMSPADLGMYRGTAQHTCQCEWMIHSAGRRAIPLLGDCVAAIRIAPEPRYLSPKRQTRLSAVSVEYRCMRAAKALGVE